MSLKSSPGDVYRARIKVLNYSIKIYVSLNYIKHREKRLLAASSTLTAPLSAQRRQIKASESFVTLFDATGGRREKILIYTRKRFNFTAAAARSVRKVACTDHNLNLHCNSHRNPSLSPSPSVLKHQKGKLCVSLAEINENKLHVFI